MVLALLLIPIELVSYIFRPISLSVRLFANMMAGHTLLKVIAGFAWTMMLAGGGLFNCSYYSVRNFSYFNVIRVRSSCYSSLCIYYFNVYLLK